MLRYPDVCTNSPASRGQAFCQDHITEMEKVCPTKLKAYLDHTQKKEGMYMNVYVS